MEPARRDAIDLADSCGADHVIGDDLKIETVTLRMDPNEAAAAAKEHRPIAAFFQNRTESADRFEQPRIHPLKCRVRARDRVAAGSRRSRRARLSCAHARSDSDAI